jgi:hypothetical protein
MHTDARKPLGESQSSSIQTNLIDEITETDAFIQQFKMLTFVEEMRLSNASYAEASNRSSNLSDANEGRQ